MRDGRPHVQKAIVNMCMLLQLSNAKHAEAVARAEAEHLRGEQRAMKDWQRETEVGKPAFACVPVVTV
jgi:hypothetical protein